MKKALMYSKPSCPFCIKAKQLLSEKGYQIEEKIVGVDASKEDVQAIVDSLGVSVTVRTVPQIFLYATSNELIYVGGYTDLAARFSKMDTSS